MKSEHFEKVCEKISTFSEFSSFKKIVFRKQIRKSYYTDLDYYQRQKISHDLVKIGLLQDIGYKNIRV